MKNIVSAFSLACAVIASPACAPASAQQSNELAVYIKQAVRGMVRDTDFVQQQATIADLIKEYPTMWYSMVGSGGPPVLQKHVNGGPVIEECRDGLNKALGQKNPQQVAKEADKCLDNVERFNAQSTLVTSQKEMQAARTKVAAFDDRYGGYNGPFNSGALKHSL